jgi:transposase-like protein
MRYSKEFIEEVVQCYIRVGNKSFVSAKYNIVLQTLNKWVTRHETNKELNSYSERIEKIKEIISYYNEVLNYDLVAQKYGFKPKKTPEILSNYKLELIWKSKNYSHYHNELKRLLLVFKQAYRRSNSALVLEKVILLELLLGAKDEYILDNYKVSNLLLNRIKDI